MSTLHLSALLQTLLLLNTVDFYLMDSAIKDEIITRDRQGTGDCFVCREMKDPSRFRVHDKVTMCLLCVRWYCSGHKGDVAGVCEINHQTYFKNHRSPMIYRDLAHRRSILSGEPLWTHPATQEHITGVSRVTPRHSPPGQRTNSSEMTLGPSEKSPSMKVVEWLKHSAALDTEPADQKQHGFRDTGEVYHGSYTSEDDDGAHDDYDPLDKIQAYTYFYDYEPSCLYNSD